MKSGRITHNPRRIKDRRHKLDKSESFLLTTCKGRKSHIKSSHTITCSSNLRSVAESIFCYIFFGLYMISIKLLQRKKSEFSPSIYHLWRGRKEIPPILHHTND
nr:MAG TPA: hypothetical protein [Bacteriophage sp.]